MTMRLLWFVLAGFLLGFSASTLWEWLHFRRERMTLRDQRVRELEEQLNEQKRLRGDMRPMAAPTPAWSQPDYHSPGVFLESEEPDEAEYSAESEPAETMIAAASAGIAQARGAIPKPISAAGAGRTVEAAASRGDLPVRSSDTIEQLAANLSSRTQPEAALGVHDFRSRYVQRSSDYPDDLSKIKGIGEIYKIRLYKAGIYTWHQIAESDVETLRAATNAYPSSNVDDWLEQARELAQKNGRQNATYSGSPPDDLTKIIGIGPVGARTLYRAGICTFEQLAGAMPAELHDLFPIAVAGDEPNFAHWISQAIELANRKLAE